MRLRLEVKHAEVVTTAKSCFYQTQIRSDGKNRAWADATRMAKITGNSRIQGITPMPYRYYLHQNRDYPVVRERVHVAIVVSSSWRESHSLDELRDFFAPDIKPRVVGVTPDMWDQALAPAYVRERECLAWLAANRPAGTRWLAIDDRPAFFQPNCPNLFLTDTLQGFLAGQMASLREKLA